ncbi:MAG: long-chain fatty acid--CoA ligase, partial [bacterium]
WDGWLYTGDLGYKDKRGYLYIADRKKDMLIVHGCNVYPREIEEVLVQHEAVSEAAVIGVPDEGRGEVPKAFVVLHEGFDTAGLELKRFCKGKLAGYKIPNLVAIMEELPKTATGKVLKRELR